MKSKSQFFQTEQLIPGVKIAEIFDFFSDEKNLEAITPPTLNFKVLGKSSEKIEEGSKIYYRLRIHGIPCRWVTLIEDWNPGQSFVDRQLKGPYQLWRHTHSFKETPEGVLMSDQVEYRLPLGALGQLLAGSWVKKDITFIFKFRAQAIARIFDCSSP